MASSIFLLRILHCLTKHIWPYNNQTMATRNTRNYQTWSCLATLVTGDRLISHAQLFSQWSRLVYMHGLPMCYIFNWYWYWTYTLDAPTCTASALYLEFMKSRVDTLCIFFASCIRQIKLLHLSRRLGDSVWTGTFDKERAWPVGVWVRPQGADAYSLFSKTVIFRAGTGLHHWHRGYFPWPFPEEYMYFMTLSWVLFS